MSALEFYNQRLADSGQRIFAGALNGARRRGQNYVVPEHIIEALGAEEDRFFQLLMSFLKIDPVQIQPLIAKRLEIFPQQAGRLRLAPVTIALLKQAWEMAMLDGRMKIESFDLILALANDPAGVLIESLRELNADAGAAAATIRALVRCAERISYKLDAEKEVSVIFTYDETAQYG
ncbi:MAG TPA: Clp protease N-terminal domain-containing protein [Blastocatellia bacterium]|jgi:ATP-dependent Clp protease ATP-binding subunit ClpA|nr:Clp protease N-terminal domain-containing protein [Blastocatellia bacterium]